MFSLDDTIVAIATPAGRGGIGVVRLSGDSATAIARSLLERERSLAPRHATFARLRARNGAGSTTDEVVATFFPAPHSYTGEDVVEISAHGSPVVLDGIVGGALASGARLARPGEFTLRAFLNGKRDLVQAEAVRDLVDAATPLQARVAFDQLEGTLTRRIAEIDRTLFDLIARLEASLDFPDEGYHFVDRTESAATIATIVEQIDALLGDAAGGRMIREGAMVVIAGRPNVGKSSLFNALCGTNRAIVTSVPGTTRDLVTEKIEIDGLAVTLVDTAGSRDTADVVEREGVLRGAEARGVADLVVVVVDGSEPATDDDRELLERTTRAPRLVVLNKHDRPLAGNWKDAEMGGELDRPVYVSAATGEGMPCLRRALVEALSGGEPLRDSAAVSNVRHISLLNDAREHLRRSGAAASAGATPEEFVLADLQAARGSLDEIVGRRTSDDILTHIFERFCIGK